MGVVWCVCSQMRASGLRAAACRANSPVRESVLTSIGGQRHTIRALRLRVASGQGEEAEFELGSVAREPAAVRFARLP